MFSGFAETVFPWGTKPGGGLQPAEPDASGTASGVRDRVLPGAAGGGVGPRAAGVDWLQCGGVCRSHDRRFAVVAGCVAAGGGTGQADCETTRGGGACRAVG